MICYIFLGWITTWKNQTNYFIFNLLLDYSRIKSVCIEVRVYFGNYPLLILCLLTLYLLAINKKGYVVNTCVWMNLSTEEDTGLFVEWFETVLYRNFLVSRIQNMVRISPNISERLLWVFQISGNLVYIYGPLVNCH